MSYDESGARDLLFVVDGSRSMGGRLKGSGMSKISIVRKGLMGFVSENWPVSYFPWPLRIGISFYRLLGTPGSARIDVVVPLNPPPATLELYRLTEMQCKGGSPLVEALLYSIRTISDSIRPDKRIKVISDGDNDGEPAKGIEPELKSAKVPIDAIELSNSASQELREVASSSGGRYYRTKNLAEFEEAIRH